MPSGNDDSQSAFRPARLSTNRETDRYVCPEGKLLGSEGRHRKRPGLVYVPLRGGVERTVKVRAPDAVLPGQSEARPFGGAGRRERRR